MAHIQYLSELFLEVLSMQGPVKPLKQNLLPKLLHTNILIHIFRHYNPMTHI